MLLYLKWNLIMLLFLWIIELSLPLRYSLIMFVLSTAYVWAVLVCLPAGSSFLCTSSQRAVFHGFPLRYTISWPMQGLNNLRKLHLWGCFSVCLFLLGHPYHLTERGGCLRQLILGVMKGHQMAN